MISLKSILETTDAYKQQTHSKSAIDISKMEKYFPKMTIANLNAAVAKIKRMLTTLDKQIAYEALKKIDAELKKRKNYIQKKI